MNEAKSQPPVAAGNRRAGWRVLLAVGVSVAAGLGLFWASRGAGAEYYKHVDEARQSGEQLLGKRVRVHGSVVPGSIVHQAGTLDYRFTLESKAPRAPATLAVRFHGITPDLFKEGAEVIAAGVLEADGTLKSERIETKCPSKYETQAQK
jgi:cytochrome c-type biogenesis protein CcmE